MSLPPSGPVLHPVVDRAMLVVADFAMSVGAFFRAWVSPPRYGRELVRQCFQIGVRTVPLIVITGMITGIVFTQQSRPSLAAFGATSWLPSLVVVALVRSLAPLVTALICAGKVASSIGAELSSMKVTEQIDALEVSAVDPVRFLLATRTMASALMVPMLTAVFGLVAFLGSYLNVHANEQIGWTAFVREGFSSITALDVWAALARAIVFGFTIGVLACYAGFRARRGTRGVGLAANRAVVQSMLAVFVLEVLIVQVISLLRGA